MLERVWYFIIALEGVNCNGIVQRCIVLGSICIALLCGALYCVVACCLSVVPCSIFMVVCCCAASVRYGCVFTALCFTMISIITFYPVYFI